MKRRHRNRPDRPSLRQRLDLDLEDCLGVLSLGCLVSGSWITWDVGIALLVAGAVMAVVVWMVALRRPPRPRQSTGRTSDGRT